MAQKLPDHINGIPRASSSSVNHSSEVIHLLCGPLVLTAHWLFSGSTVYVNQSAPHRELPSFKIPLFLIFLYSIGHTLGVLPVAGF